ncbi:hypothetical protein [Ancylomarina sp.]|uniref:hypothetical protein n=1 Tax=Ancylomarina sp. TaxID=1970196 RepID=UPI00356513D1
MEKDNRKKITQELNITVDSTALLNTKSTESLASALTNKDEERSIFLRNYENWINQYINVVEKVKSDENNIANKHRIMRLSHQAKGWQEKIAVYLNNDTFKQRYIQLSMRLSDSIAMNWKLSRTLV